MTGVPSDGWYVEIEHPSTGRVKTPEVIDLGNAPLLNPGPNALPRVRLPVRKDTVWLTDAYDDDPVMRVWRDGDRLPVEVLRDVNQREDATVLVGVGGVELEGRERVEYDNDRRHTAANDLVTNNTSYAADTPAPNTQTRTDVVQQDPDTTLEFADVLPDSGSPNYLLGSGEVAGRRVAWTREGELYDRGNEFRNTDPTDLSVYSAGDAAYLSRDSAATGGPDFVEFDFSVDREIPAEEFGFQFRVDDDPNNGLPGYIIELQHDNGNTYVLDENVGEGFTVQGPAWLDSELFDGSPYSGADLTPGSYTIRIEITDSNAGGDEFYLYLDAVAPYDKRASGDLTFDNDNGSDGSALDGPAWYVPQTITFENAPSAFNVVAGDATITIDDISGEQRLQISNDNGSTWLPDDGTEQNTTSVDVNYPSPGSGSRLRVTLDGYEPSGTRSNIPALNYESQALDAYTLRADIEQELLLIAETYDNSVESILTSIAEPAERSWRFAFDDGTPTVRFVQNGQFESNYSPEFEERTREKLGKTYGSVTIKGSNEPSGNLPYTASTSFEALPDENILPGSETVYDDTENYDRGDDYEINYQAGEIRATDGGDLVVGNDYRIDYRFRARGTYVNPDVSDPDELVETVSGVTSPRLAEQVGFVIAEDVETPRYAAEVTIPTPDPRFDPVEALPPAALGLPDGVGALEVTGSPQITEEGLRVRFGTRSAVESSLQRLSRQVSRVSDRS